MERKSVAGRLVQNGREGRIDGVSDLGLSRSHPVKRSSYEGFGQRRAGILQWSGFEICPYQAF